MEHFDTFKQDLERMDVATLAKKYKVTQVMIKRMVKSDLHRMALGTGKISVPLWDEEEASV